MGEQFGILHRALLRAWMAEQYGSEEREKMENWDMWDTSGVFSIRAYKMQKLRVLETDASQ